MKVRKLLLGSILALTIAGPSYAQHAHLNAGAVGTAQDDQLLWANGAEFVNTSGYVKSLDFTNAGVYAGYFQGNITLTALPATGGNGGPEAWHAALGSFLVVELRLESGPVGGHFGFWEAGALTPTFELALDETGRFDLSGLLAGAPGADPFGHIHGRRFTVDLPGTYTIGFTIYDVSTNGIGDGPIHIASQELLVNFAAVPEPSTTVLIVASLAVIGVVLRRRK